MRRCILVTVLSACLVSHAAGQSLIPSRELEQAGLSLGWEADLPIPTGDSIENVYLVDDSLYVVTDLGRMYSVIAEAGLLRWSVNLTEPDYQVFAPTHFVSADGAGATVVTTTVGIVVLDRFTGEIIRRVRPDFAVTSPAAAAQGVVFVGAADERMHAVNVRPATPMNLWEVTVHGAVTTQPRLYGGGKLVFASRGGRVYSCLAGDKSLVWRVDTFGQMLSGPRVHDGHVYASSGSRAVYKIDGQTGRVHWRARFSRALEKAPQPAGDAVYQYVKGLGVTALDGATGEERWTAPLGLSLAAHTSAGAILHTVKDALAVLDTKTGELIGYAEAPGVAGVVDSGGLPVAFAYGARDRLSCIKLADAPYLRRQQVMAIERTMNRRPDKTIVDDMPEGVDRRRETRDPFRSRNDVPPK